MQISSASLVQRYRMLAAVYLACVFAVTAVLGWLTLHDNFNRPWTVGDWLINYQGGFVRRGFVGEILFHVARWSHVNIAYLAVTLAVLLYGVLLLAVWMMLQRSSWNFWILLLLFSPATLVFQVLDFKGGFRKELLFLAALAAFLVWTRRVQRSSAAWAGFLSIACAMCVLSHEGLLCYLPYLGAAAYLVAGSRKRTLLVVAIPLLVSAAGTREVTQHHGDRTTALAICESIQPVLPYATVGWCTGSIKSLISTPAGERAGVLNLERESPAFRTYAITSVLAFFPVVWGCVRLWREQGARPAVMAIVGASAIAWCASIVLFHYGQDWGRWIYIHLVSLFLLLLFVEFRQHDRAAVERGPVLPEGWRASAAAMALLLYMTVWNLPYFPTHPYNGTVGLAYRAWHHQIPR